MGTESVRETPGNLHILTLLSARENALQLKYDSAYIVRVTSLISDIKGNTRVMGEREQGDEETVWT